MNGEIKTIQTDLLTPEQRSAYDEYKTRIAGGKFIVPDKIKDKTIYDCLLMPEFETNLSACIDEQLQSRKLMKETVDAMRAKGKKVVDPRSAIDRAIELGLMADCGTFTVEFANVIARRSKLPMAIREYVYELGMRAYNMLMHEFIRDANADMAELYKIVLTPKS